MITEPNSISVIVGIVYNMIKKIDKAIKSLEDLEFDKDFRKLIDIDRDDYMSKFDLKFVYVLSYLKEVKRLKMEN